MTAHSSAKVCSKCGASDWGTRNRCNPCRAKAQRDEWAANANDVQLKDMDRRRRWRLLNPDRVREQHRRQLYAIEPETFERLLAEQEHRCAICQEPDPNCVDHCHESRRVRGVLCRKCNAGLGQFRDDPYRLFAAVKYLVASYGRAEAEKPTALVPKRRRHSPRGRLAPSK